MQPETTRDALQPIRAREERVIALLLAGRPPKEICEQVPMSRTTLWRLRGCAEFQKRLTEARQQAFESAVNCLHDGAVVFVKTLREVCEDPKARGSEKASAARSGLDSLFKAAELFDIEARLRKLEAASIEGQK